MIKIKTCTIEDIVSSYLYDNMILEYESECKNKNVNVDTLPNIDKYKAVESAGVLLCFGVYNDDTLVGFCIVIISEMLHYSQLATTVESQFILKEYRRFGTARKMYDFVERECIRRGSKAMFMSAPIGSALDKISKSIGYTPISTFFIKKIV